MTRKLFAGLTAFVIIVGLFSSCGMFGDLEALREEAKEANTPVTPVDVPVITIDPHPNGLNVAVGYTTSHTMTVGATVTQEATLSYQWYSNTSNSVNGGTAIPGETGTSYTIPLGLEEGDHYYFCEVSATGGAASVRSTPAIFNVGSADKPLITINPDLADPDPMTFGSISGSLSVSASVTLGATLSYQWWSNTIPSNSGGTAVTSVTTSPAFTIPTTLNAGYHYYYCNVTATGGANNLKSSVVLVTVKPKINISTQPAAPGSLDAGASSSLSVAVTVGGGGTPSIGYRWYSNTSSSNSGGTAVTTVTTTPAFTIPTNTAGTYYYFCEVTASVLAIDADAVRSNPVTVTVKPKININTQPASNTPVTAGNISGNLTVAATVTGGGSPSYQWYSNTTASNVGGTSLGSGARNQNFTIPTNLANGTYYYYCVVSATSGGQSASVPSNVATVSVGVPVITINTHPAPNTTVSVGKISGSLSVGATVTGSATLSHQWYSNTSASNVGGTAVPSGGTSASFTIPTSLAEGTHYYFCEVRATSGAIPVRSNPATVRVMDGIGTVGDPFKVKNVDDLQSVGKGIDGWTLSAHYQQTANIDLTGKVWTPISSLSGTYDGNGKKISNLTVTESGENRGGLFSSIGVNGTVKNLTLDNVDIVGGSGGAGGVAGSNNGTIQACSVTGKIKGTTVAGGITSTNYSKIINCYSGASVEGGESAGGIAGWSGNTGTSITNCYATGSIKDSTYVGGIVGSNWAEVWNCVALNSSIIKTGEGTSNFGRVNGTTTGSLANNYGNVPIMKYEATGSIYEPGSNSSSNDGANVASGTGSGQYNNQSWWANASTGPGFKFGSNEDNPWKMVGSGSGLTGALPKLWFEP